MEKKGNYREFCKDYTVTAESISIDSSVENLEISASQKTIFEGEAEGISYTNYEAKTPTKEKGIESVDYETDGHYSTVYLVCLMLGMSDNKAEALAIATENPDTDVHSPTKFEIDQTWAYPHDQRALHSLTGGFHGDEEFLTALKFIYLNNNDLYGSKDEDKAMVDELGGLLHRLGDTYAHARLDNLLPSDLGSYDLPKDEKKIIESWKGQGGEDLSLKIISRIDFINYNINKYGYAFLTSEYYQREAMDGKTLQEYIRDVFLKDPSDKFIMYGNTSMPATAKHFITDGGYPDMIYMRPEWYLCYVKNLAWMISTRYTYLTGDLKIEVFNRMVEFAKKHQCSMKGIIDYEISKIRGKKETYIPVYYAKAVRVFAKFDEQFNTDYLKNAEAVSVNTMMYIIEIGEGENAECNSHYGDVIKTRVSQNGIGYEIETYKSKNEDYFIIKHN